jgi:hypothetical protein
MAGQLLPPPEISPSLPDDLPPQEGIRLWMDLTDVCEQFLLAGLRREIGPEGDLQAAYRSWYAAQMEEHDRAMFRMLSELSRREAAHVE